MRRECEVRPGGWREREGGGGGGGGGGGVGRETQVPVGSMEVSRRGARDELHVPWSLRKCHFQKHFCVVF